MKKILAVAMTAVMGLSLAACGSSSSSSAGSSAASASGASSAASASGETYKVGICQLVTHDALDAATQGFKDALEEALPGQV